MKIVVTAHGNEMSSDVDTRFGRAKCFMLIDTETGEFTAHDNTQNLNASQGAGIQAGQNVLELGVEAVVTGNVGPKAFRTLQAAGVAVYIGGKGTVAETLELFKTDKLDCVSSANVEGHWV